MASLLASLRERLQPAPPCGICLDSLDETTRAHVKEHRARDGSMQRTYHLFHRTCLERWFLESPSCPTCRDPLLEGDNIQNVPIRNLGTRVKVITRLVLTIVVITTTAAAVGYLGIRVARGLESTEFAKGLSLGVKASLLSLLAQKITHKFFELSQNFLEIQESHRELVSYFMWVMPISAGVFMLGREGARISSAEMRGIVAGASLTTSFFLPLQESVSSLFENRRSLMIGSISVMLSYAAATGFVNGRHPLTTRDIYSYRGLRHWLELVVVGVSCALSSIAITLVVYRLRLAFSEQPAQARRQA